MTTQLGEEPSHGDPLASGTPSLHSEETLRSEAVIHVIQSGTYSRLPSPGGFLMEPQPGPVPSDEDVVVSKGLNALAPHKHVAPHKGDDPTRFWRWYWFYIEDVVLELTMNRVPIGTIKVPHAIYKGKEPKGKSGVGAGTLSKEAIDTALQNLYKPPEQPPEYNDIHDVRLVVPPLPKPPDKGKIPDEQRHAHDAALNTGVILEYHKF